MPETETEALARLQLILRTMKVELESCDCPERQQVLHKRIAYLEKRLNYLAEFKVPGAGKINRRG